MTELPEHLGGHSGKTHIDKGALGWFTEMGFSSFLDVGCGPGGMVHQAEIQGFDSFGIDGDFTLERYNPERFLIHDFTTGPVSLDRTFDVCWCVEFVEHVYAEYILNFAVAWQQCKNLAMTHATPGQGGYHHVNEQPKEYWIDVLDQYGFDYSESMTEELKLRTTMNTHKKPKKAFVRNNGLYFKNRNL